MSQNTSFFMNQQPKGFGSVSPDDEKFHRGARDEDDSPALVETQFIGFNVPAADIHSLNYVWAHPNVGIVSGGPWAWQGVKSHQLASEIFNMEDFMPESVILDGGDLDDYTLPSGYGVEVIEPFEKLRIFYDDPSRQNAFDVTMTAIMPPAMISTNRHFDQAMRTEGRLLLRGRPHTVDGYTVRDRSWGEARPEDPRQAPPIHWTTAVFGDDFAVHAMGMEDPAVADWGPSYPGFPPEVAAQLGRGWVWAEGELRQLESVRFTSSWDLDRGHPRGHRLELTDDDGREYVLDGTVGAASEWSTWSNVRMAVGLLRWECEGRTGFGDHQSAMWTDFVHSQLFHSRSRGT